MKLKKLLSENRSAILNRWFDIIVEMYPHETTKFLKSQKNQFANPVGSTLTQGLEGIFNEILLKETDSDRVSTFLDNIIRVRAIQDFTPSQALAFIFLLKKVIREELGKEIRGKQISDELMTFESRIDNLALISFDIYMKCREKLYEIKADEVKRNTFRLLQQAKLITDPELASGQEQEPASEKTI